MKDKSQIKVFMSYRREGGIATARSLYNEFRLRGYDMFLDMEGLRACAFNTALIDEIKTSDVMLLILTPGALDRCEEPTDWVRQEVLCALESGVTVIPVLEDGYPFPKKMPEGMEKISGQNAIWINYRLYDAFVDKLEEYILSAPQNVKRKEEEDKKKDTVDLKEKKKRFEQKVPGNHSKDAWMKYLIGAVCILVAVAVIGAIVSKCGTAPDKDPDTGKQPPSGYEGTEQDKDQQDQEQIDAGEELSQISGVGDHGDSSMDSIGNTAGNLCNDGMTSLSGFNSKSSKHVKYINVLDSWLYWYNQSKRTVYAKNGEEDTFALLDGERLSYLLATPEWFYYIVSSEADGVLYRSARIDNGAALGQKEKILTGISKENHVIIDKSKVYYWQASMGLYCMDLSTGQNSQVFAKDNTWTADLIGLIGDWIYGHDPYEVWRVNVKSGEKDVLALAENLAEDSRIAAGNAYGSWIYFVLTDANHDIHYHADNIYRMRTDGTEPMKLFTSDFGCVLLERLSVIAGSKVELALADEEGSVYYRIDAETGAIKELVCSPETAVVRSLGTWTGNTLSNLCNHAFIAPNEEGKGNYISSSSAVEGYHYYANNGGLYHVEDDDVKVVWNEESVLKSRVLIRDKRCQYLYVTPDWLYCVLEEDGISTLYRAENHPEEHTIGPLYTIASDIVGNNQVAIYGGRIYYWVLKEGLYQCRTDGTGAELLYSIGNVSHCRGWETFEVSDGILYFQVSGGGLYKISLEDGTLSQWFDVEESIPGARVEAAVADDHTVYFVVKYTEDSEKEGLEEIWSMRKDSDHAEKLHSLEANQHIRDINVIQKIYLKMDTEAGIGLYRLPLGGGELELITELP